MDVSGKQSHVERTDSEEIAREGVIEQFAHPVGRRRENRISTGDI